MAKCDKLYPYYKISSDGVDIFCLFILILNHRSFIFDTKDLDDFRHRKLTLQVRKLQTAADQKYFEIVGIKKNIFPELTHLFIYILIVFRRSLCNRYHSRFFQQLPHQMAA